MMRVHSVGGSTSRCVDVISHMNRNRAFNRYETTLVSTCIKVQQLTQLIRCILC